jgi:hypothetical protein
MHFNILPIALLSIAVTTACAGSAPVVVGNPDGPAVTPSGLQVTVTVASATLGDEGCTPPSIADSGARTSSDVAGGAQAKCAADASADSCQFACRGTSAQLSLVAGPSGLAAKVRVVRVALIDAKSGAELESLTPGTALAWADSSYVAWDGAIKPSATIKASYPLSAPSWSRIAPNSFSGSFRIQVSLEIDGAKTNAISAPLSREPVVAT